MASNATLLKLSAAVGVAVAIFLLDWWYLSYITSYGLEQKTQELVFGSLRLAVPLQWAPVLGIMIVSLVAWYEVATQLFPRRPGLEFDSMAKLRLVRAVAISLALFVCVLYIPYLVGSNWFWARLGDMSKNITQVRDFGLSLLHTIEPIMLMNTLWQYAASQNLAAAAMVLGAWAFGRAARRPRKQR